MGRKCKLSRISFPILDFNNIFSQFTCDYSTFLWVVQLMGGGSLENILKDSVKMMQRMMGEGA